ncbi:MAG TPA: STAS domain-containing protein [Planctomycetota bacterium]|nr:STAS domain-containing protein [Planctomycetota bacterium]HRU51118.1 STAS domain-containing protein [Planctomycetota bacterium]
MIEFQTRQVKLADGSPVIVCRIKGSIDGTTIFQFEEKLLGFFNQGVRHLIIVFSQVNYINSTGMGVLVKLADKFQEVDGDCNLVDVPDKMVALFNMLGLLALIKLSKNEEEALQSFQAKLTKQAGGTPAPTTPQKPPQPSTSIYAPPPSSSARSSTINTAVRNVMHKTAPMQESSVPPRPSQKQVYVIQCKYCKKKISLGTTLKEGKYKCPTCSKIFRVLANGKIEYLS